jgi:hypothetical protein
VFNIVDYHVSKNFILLHHCGHVLYLILQSLNLVFRLNFPLKSRLVLLIGQDIESEVVQAVLVIDEGSFIQSLVVGLRKSDHGFQNYFLTILETRLLKAAVRSFF